MRLRLWAVDDDPRIRADRHDATAARLHHAPRDRLRHEELGVDVDVHHVPPLLRRYVQQGRVGTDADAVHQHIGGLEVAGHVPGDGLGSGPVAQVRVVEADSVAGRFGQLFRRRRPLFSKDVDDRDFRARVQA